MASYKVRAALGIAAAALVAVSCVGTGVDTYDGFSSAVKKDAPCDELFDMREGFDDRDDLARIDADLRAIGCESPESTRTDG